MRELTRAATDRADANHQGGRRERDGDIIRALYLPIGDPGSAMTIELLYFDGCPSHEAFVPRLHDLLAQAGVDAPIEQRRVESDADAQRERFLGSPTLRVDGVDVDPAAGDRTDYGLKCRLYPVAGRLSGVPPDEWVLDALRRRH